MNLKSVMCQLSLLFVLSCEPSGPGTQGQQGSEGMQGQQGSEGQQGPPGPPGPTGMNGRDAVGFSDTNGTRLKRYASVTSSDDGLKVTTPGYLFRDTSLNVDCYFQTTADGMQRCLPYGRDVITLGTPIFFSDAGCTVPLYYTNKPCMTPKYLLVTANLTATCPATSQYAVYSMGAAITPTAMYSGSPGSCTALSKSSIDSYLMSFVFYDLSGKLPISSSTFAAGTTTQVLLP